MKREKGKREERLVLPGEVKSEVVAAVIRGAVAVAGRRTQPLGR